MALAAPDFFSSRALGGSRVLVDVDAKNVDVERLCISSCEAVVGDDDAAVAVLGACIRDVEVGGWLNN